MVVQIALWHAREENARRWSDSIQRKSIASAQMAPGSGVRRVTNASPEVQPLRWRAESEVHAHLVYEENMTWCAQCARHRA